MKNFQIFFMIFLKRVPYSFTFFQSQFLNLLLLKVARESKDTMSSYVALLVEKIEQMESFFCAKNLFQFFKWKKFRFCVLNSFPSYQLFETEQTMSWKFFCNLSAFSQELRKWNGNRCLGGFAWKSLFAIAIKACWRRLRAEISAITILGQFLIIRFSLLHFHSLLSSLWSVCALIHDLPLCREENLAQLSIPQNHHHRQTLSLTVSWDLWIP